MSPSSSSNGVEVIKEVPALASTSSRKPRTCSGKRRLALSDEEEMGGEDMATLTRGAKQAHRSPEQGSSTCDGVARESSPSSSERKKFSELQDVKASVHNLSEAAGPFVQSKGTTQGSLPPMTAARRGGKEAPDVEGPGAEGSDVDPDLLMDIFGQMEKVLPKLSGLASVMSRLLQWLLHDFQAAATGLQTERASILSQHATLEELL